VIRAADKRVARERQVGGDDAAQAPRFPSAVTCPSCGYASDDIRCPRCNALKLSGCTGACLTCGVSSCGAKP